ncbi:FGFR1 oncogene partner isoform X2 [Erpetoichthys calabaricus]|uniref:FGFR1 oncogene partner isoform X2 n=1 Tax=Erpetoichthys calabaricus TaxID=27687 RepID=UPI002234DEC0|nr:FGFR1 oncogene partner isoform X2 [Erpetoichthys calabaricus]
MSATEEDNELRDLLVQNLENSGVLNKIKAELRAAVFLALEEQEKTENKIPLINESLKKFLNTKDGRLVASLITEFLEFFNLDFTLAVFRPEINMLNGLESREVVARELGISETDGTKAPLLLEVLKRGQRKEKDKDSSFAQGDCIVRIPKDLSPKQMTEARRIFEKYDKDKNGKINKEELRTLFTDLFPHFHKNMLERYVTDEFRAVDKDFSNSIDFIEFLGMYKRFFIQCRSVVAEDISEIIQSSNTFLEEKPNILLSTSKANSKVFEARDIESLNNIDLGSDDPKLDIKQSTISRIPLFKSGMKNHDDDDDDDNDEDKGDLRDSFFDDPSPKPEKIYGRRADSIRHLGNLTSLSDAPCFNLDNGTLTGVLPVNKFSKSGNINEFKMVSEAITSLELGDEDYDDEDFHSHRSEKSKSEAEGSILEEIEEDIFPDGGDFIGSDKFDDITVDCSISQLSEAADYMEEVT